MLARRVAGVDGHIKAVEEAPCDSGVHADALEGQFVSALLAAIAANRAAVGEVEREQLRRVKDALGLRENGALWLVQVALRYCERLNRQFSKAIASEAARVLGQARGAAEAQLRAGAERREPISRALSRLRRATWRAGR